jgi:predicted phosphodiesterase
MQRKRTNFLLVIFSALFVLVGGSFLFLKAHEEPKKLLHFVQLSDTHLNHHYARNAERILGGSEKLLREAVEQINEIEDLDFVLATGDLVDIPERKLVDQFIEITMGLKYPLYVTLGNHDVSVNGGLGKRGFIRRFYKQENATSFTSKKTYYSFSPNEKFTIICLDGTTDKIVTANGQIDDEQLEWLRKELEANKDKFVIIALHFPLIEPFKSQTHFFLEPDRTKLSSLINLYPNVVGIFTGHYHAAKLFKIKNKIHNSCPAIVQYPNAFREIFVYKEDPKHITFDFKWHPVNIEELRQISKNTSKWAIAQGTEEDRVQKIKLKIYQTDKFKLTRDF